MLVSTNTLDFVRPVGKFLNARMLNIFSDEVRRDPFATYEQMRTRAPAFYAPPPFDGWLIFDYETVKRVLNDHETFSSAVPAPRNWFVFMDAPAHSKLRAGSSLALSPC